MLDPRSVGCRIITLFGSGFLSFLKAKSPFRTPTPLCTIGLKISFDHFALFVCLFTCTSSIPILEVVLRRASTEGMASRTKLCSWGIKTLAWYATNLRPPFKACSNAGLQEITHCKKHHLHSMPVIFCLYDGMVNLCLPCSALSRNWSCPLGRQTIFVVDFARSMLQTGTGDLQSMLNSAPVGQLLLQVPGS